MVSRSVLTQYRDLRKELQEIRKRIVETNDELSKIESEGAVRDSVKGGIGGVQTFRIEGFPTEEYSRRKSLLYSRIEQEKALEIRVDELILQVNEFISTINDSTVRRIMVMRYVDGMNFDEIGKRMGYEQSSIRKKLNRYIDDAETL